MVTSAREHIYDLRSLENYTYVDDVGKDQVRTLRDVCSIHRRDLSSQISCPCVRQILTNHFIFPVHQWVILNTVNRCCNRRIIIICFQGINIRHKVRELIDFIQDDEKLREERKKAKKNKDKYIGQALLLILLFSLIVLKLSTQLQLSIKFIIILFKIVLSIMQNKL